MVGLPGEQMRQRVPYPYVALQAAATDVVDLRLKLRIRCRFQPALQQACFAPQGLFQFAEICVVDHPVVRFPVQAQQARMPDLADQEQVVEGVVDAREKQVLVAGNDLFPKAVQAGEQGFVGVGSRPGRRSAFSRNTCRLLCFEYRPL